MKKIFLPLLCVLLAGCHTHYSVVETTGWREPIDSRWDAAPDAEMQALIQPYTHQIEKTMATVIGESAMDMDRKRPESLLGNLISDILRNAATRVIGKPADIGLMNVGGIRNVITKGPITMDTAFELLPFENSLCVLTMKGSDVNELLHEIAIVGGEGLSGIKLAFNRKGEVLEALCGGKPIENDKLYTLATIDFLTEGNDGMMALTKAVKCDCPPQATLRDLFIEYVKQQTAAGKKLAATLEGRVTVKE